MQALSPRLFNVLPDEGMWPTTIEITLPGSMTVIPFWGKSGGGGDRAQDGPLPGLL